MSKELSKLSKLVIAESYVQTHFTKGYKYIDKAGEIVNCFYDGDKEPIFNMDPSGLTISKPNEKVDAFRITPGFIWAHFISPESNELIEYEYRKKTKDILRIIEPASISRIGWRNYFIHEFKTEDERKRILDKLTPISGVELSESAFLMEIQGVDLTIRIQKVLNDQSSTPGLLLDIDFSKKYSAYISIDKFASELFAIKKVIHSDELLEKINEILTE